MTGRRAVVAGVRGWAVNFLSFFKLFLKFLYKPSLHRFAGLQKCCDDLVFSGLCD
jgi:uncharacterized membrane protein